MDGHPYERFRDQIQAALQSKIDEFKLFNYDRITTDNLWEYLINKKWRKPKEDIHLYEIVNDIMSVSVSDIISFGTVQQMSGPDLFSEEGLKGLKELFGK